MTRISIVIPCFNSAHCLRETLEHALAQTAPAHEILIVDDGSTDDTPELVRSFGDRVRYLRQQNRGPAAARNHAIEQATGDWIAFLDHDDLFLPEKLARQGAIAEAHPELVAIYSGFTYLYPDGSRADAAAFPARDLWPALRYRTPILPSSAMVRRSALRQTASWPRSVIAQRLPARPYSATFIAQWFSAAGRLGPLRAQAYQGENTLPICAMMVSPCAPSSLSASTYHHA